MSAVDPLASVCGGGGGGCIGGQEKGWRVDGWKSYIGVVGSINVFGNVFSENIFPTTFPNTSNTSKHNISKHISKHIEHMRKRVLALRKSEITFS